MCNRCDKLQYIYIYIYLISSLFLWVTSTPVLTCSTRQCSSNTGVPADEHRVALSKLLKREGRAG